MQSTGQGDDDKRLHRYATVGVLRWCARPADAPRGAAAGPVRRLGRCGVVAVSPLSNPAKTDPGPDVQTMPGGADAWTATWYPHCNRCRRHDGRARVGHWPGFVLPVASAADAW